MSPKERKISTPVAAYVYLTLFTLFSSYIKTMYLHSYCHSMMSAVKYVYEAYSNCNTQYSNCNTQYSNCNNAKT